MQKIVKSKKYIIALLLALGLLTGCNTNSSDTRMEFSFHSNDPKDSHSEKKISFSENIDRLVLDGSIKVECGTVMLSVINEETKEIVWSQDYFHDTDFIIALVHLKAGNHYTFVVDTKQTKSVQLILTSEKKIVEDVEKPEVE